MGFSFSDATYLCKKYNTEGECVPSLGCLGGGASECLEFLVVSWMERKTAPSGGCPGDAELYLAGVVVLAVELAEPGVELREDVLQECQHLVGELGEVRVHLVRRV